MTRLAGLLGVVGFVLCLFTMGFGIFARQSKTATAAKSTRRSTVLLGVLVFAAVWIWLKDTIPLLAWAWWIGDNPHWFYDACPYLTALVAAAFTGVVGLRVATGRATSRYVRVHFYCSVILLGIYATLISYEFIRQIEGMDARTAAESILKRSTDLVAEGAYLLDQQPNEAAVADARCRTFWIMGTNESRGRITVCRYHRLWWSYAGSERFRPSTEELQRAKTWLEDRVNRDHAPLILKQIVHNYPGTKAAKEAQELLDGLSDAASR